MLQNVGKNAQDRLDATVCVRERERERESGGHIEHLWVYAKTLLVAYYTTKEFS